MGNKSKSSLYMNGKILQGDKMGKVMQWEVKSEPKALDYIAIESQVKFLMGDVLTIVDASYTDPIQRKAVKDLIKNSFHSKLNWLYELCGYPDLGHPHGSEPLNEYIDPNLR